MKKEFTEGGPDNLVITGIIEVFSRTVTRQIHNRITHDEETVSVKVYDIIGRISGKKQAELNEIDERGLISTLEKFETAFIAEMKRQATTISLPSINSELDRLGYK